MNLPRILLSTAFAMLPAIATGAQTPDAKKIDAMTYEAVDAFAATSPSTSTAVPAEPPVRAAIANAFRKADQPACSSEGIGCSIAETALRTGLFDEREQYRANEHLRER